MARHLEDKSKFIDAFAEFHRLLNNKVLFKNEENVCRLFDMWLANYKDERMIEEQLKKAPWEDEPGF